MAGERTYPVAKLGFVDGLTRFTVFSPFGPRVLNGRNQFHGGIDITAYQGHNLYSPFRGKIITKRVERGTRSAGLYLTIQSQASDGSYFFCLLMHLHSVDSNIYVGKQVEAGDLLGTTGGAVWDTPNCGSSTGPHLHFEIRIGSNDSAHRVNPDVFLSNHTLVYRNNRTYSPTNLNYVVSNDITTISQLKFTVEQGTDLTDPNHTEDNSEAPKKNAVASGRTALGIWQIVKLLMDSSVNNKQICDSSIATQTGPLINFFNKVCQRPFVEFMGETFGNQYYFIVRRPPFDKEGFQRLLNDATIAIEDREIINLELQWSNSNIYSWYRYIPQGDLLGGAQEQFFIPAVFFPEFASVWGSKPLCIESNYFNYMKSGFYNMTEDQKKKENARRILVAALNDFKYLVESNAYNAFTRVGSVTLRENRQIKRGTLVSLPNGEVYHVDSVSQNYDTSIGSISRTTTLQLSHGVFPEFIEGKTVDGEKRSYFNIIDFGDWNENKITLENYREMVSKWKVNYNTFSFFMRRQQVTDAFDTGYRGLVSFEK